MKVLIVEDEILIQKSLAKLLEKRGVDVDTSSTGRKAVELIKTNNYDRIVCDLMLKDITGFNIIEDSKSKYSVKEISKIFIIITAYSSDTVLEEARKYGCILLKKPFKDIKKAIETVMEPYEK